jgi:hypothetical protein
MVLKDLALVPSGVGCCDLRFRRQARGLSPALVYFSMFSVIDHLETHLSEHPPE